MDSTDIVSLRKVNTALAERMVNTALAERKEPDKVLQMEQLSP